MTTTGIIKQKLSDMEINLPGLEEVLDIPEGELSKDEWSKENIDKVKSELRSVWDVVL